MEGLVVGGAGGGCATIGPARQRTIELAAPTQRLREIGWNFTDLSWAVSSRPASQRKRSAVLDEGSKSAVRQRKFTETPVRLAVILLQRRTQRAILPFLGAVTVAPSGLWNGESFSEGHENSFD